MGLLIGIGSTKPTFPYDYYYGVEWDITVSNPKLKRIGKMELHKELPLQNMMKRCVIDDNGNVKYYLHPNDSTKRDNGASADLTGKDGMYMVELPDMYVRFEQDGNNCRCLLSQHALPGFSLWPKEYVSAVEATIKRKNNVVLASVCTTDPDYRGGANQSDWDGTHKSLLGKPATVESITRFRQLARSRGKGWEQYGYITHKKLWWLFVVEYATFNSQAPFNAELTEEGYRQGGLGDGVTTWNWTDWPNHNSCYPICDCGVTNPLGNHSGEVSFTVNAQGKSEKEFKANSYRGVENPFGHIWKWTDGCRAMIQTDEEGGESQFYVANNRDDWETFSKEKYTLRGLMARREGYAKRMVFGEQGDMVPAEVGGGTTTYLCDYFYTNVAKYNGERVLCFGGYVAYGAYAGFASAYADSSVTGTSAYIGSRLCFYP